MLDNLNETLSNVGENAKETFEKVTENVDLGELKDKAQDVLDVVVEKTKDLFDGK